MSKEFAARRLDVRGFAEEAAILQGQPPLQDFVRLSQEIQGPAHSPVSWSATGEMRNPGHVQPEIWLHLRARASLPLACQRCLGPVELTVTVDRSFRFVPDEDMAAAQDEESEEDVLALSRNFDLLELIEDELLMGMPLAPRHGTCPVPVKLATEDPEFEEASAGRENPFAALGRLKTRKP